MTPTPYRRHGICCGGPYNAKHVSEHQDVFTVAVERGTMRAVPGQQASTVARPCQFGDYLFDEPSRTWVWDESSLRDTYKPVEKKT